MSAERRPNRTLGGIHSEFWEYCADGELRIQHCTTCSGYTWPPAEICEHCGSSQLNFEPMSGQGKVVAACSFHQKYYEVLAVPYDTILVELDEGPMFISDPEGFSNDEIIPSMPVKVTFRDCEDDAGEFKLPTFERI